MEKTGFMSSCPSINGQFPQSLRQAQILILEILQCIPAVKIFAFLDLEQIFSFMDGHEFIPGGSLLYSGLGRYRTAEKGVEKGLSADFWVEISFWID
ncbi:MAG: hypothetical protein JRH13_12200 [Deltaproteobacteria bacterium]|nr:hypothetical protein [Deltaproteobacteria bacterium]MBW2130114.1 hypothetical protein [Deltaproteobacteria bacterium]MBW2303736.1 hypothetical protein [Deltaproteobacteria bacterium]